MTQYHHFYDQHHLHHHHHHDHHHHYHNHQESIHVTPLVPDKTTNPVKPASTDPVDCKPTSPVNAKSTDQVDSKSTVQTDNKSSNQINTSPLSTKAPVEICLFDRLPQFISLVILVTLLVSNYMALKTIVTVEYSLFVIVSLFTLHYNKFCRNSNGLSASINDAPKDIKQKLEKGLLPWFFINLVVLIAALLIENSWILKLLSMITPLGLLISVGLAIYFEPDIQLE